MKRRPTGRVSSIAVVVAIAAVLLTLPAFAAAPAQIVRIKANGSNSAVVKAGGDLWVWGHNASGQLGRDLDKFIFRPVQNCDIGGVLSVTGGTSHSIALKEDGTVWTWGKDEKG